MGLLGGMIAGSIARRHTGRRQFEAMQAERAQQEQINQVQAQAAQAYQVAQTSITPKKDPIKELEKLGTMKQQGILTEEEFQKKIKLISNIQNTNSFKDICLIE